MSPAQVSLLVISVAGVPWRMRRLSGAGPANHDVVFSLRSRLEFRMLRNECGHYVPDWLWLQA